MFQQKYLIILWYHNKLEMPVKFLFYEEVNFVASCNKILPEAY
jgi:hypothetical protein